MPHPSRRRFVATVMCASCCGGLAQASIAPPEIDQITDVGASAATGMFRFEPNFLRVGVGDSIAILNSHGEHTVHTAPDLWPEGVPKVAISNQPKAEITFPLEGLYGFRCKRHGQYGMVMLIVAGAPVIDDAVRERLTDMKAMPRERDAFAALVERYGSA